MTVLKISAAVLTGTLILILIKKHSSEFSVLLEIALCFFVFLILFPDLKELYLSISELFSGSGINKECVKILLKSFAVLFFGSVVSDICCDNGESALGNIAETAVKITALLCAVPVFSAVVKIALSFLS